MNHEQRPIGSALDAMTGHPIPGGPDYRRRTR